MLLEEKRLKKTNFTVLRNGFNVAETNISLNIALSYQTSSLYIISDVIHFDGSSFKAVQEKESEIIIIFFNYVY